MTLGSRRVGVHRITFGPVRPRRGLVPWNPRFDSARRLQNLPAQATDSGSPLLCCPRRTSPLADSESGARDRVESMPAGTTNGTSNGPFNRASHVRLRRVACGDTGRAPVAGDVLRRASCGHRHRASPCEGCPSGPPGTPLCSGKQHAQATSTGTQLLHRSPRLTTTRTDLRAQRSTRREPEHRLPPLKASPPCLHRQRPATASLSRPSGPSRRSRGRSGAHGREKGAWRIAARSPGSYPCAHTVDKGE